MQFAMTADSELEERFRKAQNVLHYVSRPVAFLGMWPVNVTTGSRIRMILYFTYHIYRMGMEFIDLFMVFGDLEQVIENLMITGTQVAIMMRLTFPRFTTSMRRVLDGLADLHQRNKFNDTREMEIFIEYSDLCEKCYRIVVWAATFACISWYMLPVQTYLIVKIRNGTFTYESPWRMPPFQGMDKPEVIMLLHLIEIPAAYLTACYSLTYCIYFTLVNHIRSQLVIMSYKIRNLKVDGVTTMRELFNSIVEKHIEILHISKSLDDCSHIYLLFELLNTILTLALLSYNIMMNISLSETALIINFFVYMYFMTVLVFANCYMSQCLEKEAVNLFYAFYEHDWSNLPLPYQKAFIICMLRAQTPLHITAGKFYEFSLSGFTSIMKSCATKIEGRFIKAQNILDYVSRPLWLLGMWPVNVTMGSRIRMVMYFIYHFYRIGMELIEFVMVFGNLDLVIENLMMTGLQIAMVLRLALPRLAGSMRRVLETLKDLHQRNKFKDTGEMEIFIEFSERSERCYKVVLWCATIACVSWYVSPIQNYLLAGVRNETFIYEAPWRMPEFVATERPAVALIVHIMELPAVYISYCYMISYSVYLTLINHIRCQLAIVSYEVRNFKVDRMGHTKEVLSPIVERHITALHVAKSLSDCTHISLLAELFAVSVTLALLMYNIMVVSESASSQNRIKMINFGMYVVNMLLIMFANCYMGQSLEDEGLNLSDAFYNNDWTNLPVSVQKSFVICIIHSQRRLQLTAGKFYKFSLNGFTKVNIYIIAFIMNSLDSLPFFTDHEINHCVLLNAEDNDLNSVDYCLRVLFPLFSVFIQSTMTPDSELEERFRQAQDVLSQVSLPLVHLGLWPLHPTVGSRLKLFIYFLYHGSRMIFELIELVTVLDDLQQVVDNLMTTSTQIVLMSRVTTFRFHWLSRKIINTMNQLHTSDNFNDSMETEIFIEHRESSKSFQKFMLPPVILCTVSWYMTPLGYHIIGILQNTTVPLVAPYRMPAFIDMSRSDVAVGVYIYELPMLYSGVLYLTTYSIHLTFINDICAHLIILSHRIRSVKMDRSSDIRKVIGRFVEKHIVIMKVANQLDNCTSLYLLFELFSTTLLIGLCSYNIVVNISTSEKVLLFNYLLYMLIIVFLVYINCSMGQRLDTEAANLFVTLGECEWHNLPRSFQKAQIMCMLQARTPLQMTAGHFYKFSLESFTSILKTSMAYVSMLRRII
ncbi:uncharacterized protein LOC135165408 [Diachasmimorpha longicaudata]|uniref:uncharacterized protein LOC135165408 n=1 Tax=Diachasmimorpha longicaudata TaxID=58733 RepID=UPI0030B8D7A1